jgi:hypothetical protein
MSDHAHSLETTANIDIAALLADAVPFQSTHPPPPPPRALPQSVRRRRAASAWVAPSEHGYRSPVLHSSDPEQIVPPARLDVAPTLSPPTDTIPAPAPRRPCDDVSLADYATLSAEIDLKPDVRQTTLDAAGLDEARFDEVHQRWQAAIDGELDRGRWELGAAYDDAYVARMELERGALDIHDYTLIEVAQERGRSDAQLDAMAIPRVAAMPIMRCWIRRIASNFELVEQYGEARRAASVGQ